MGHQALVLQLCLEVVNVFVSLVDHASLAALAVLFQGLLAGLLHGLRSSEGELLIMLASHLSQREGLLVACQSATQLHLIQTLA